jgi:uncharacterized damage-inducible protein DinB/predicted RNase H-like HicB family nuclease
MPFIINQRRPYHVYIEAGKSGAMAHVAELPGCFALGSSASQAAAAIPAAIIGFLAWLKTHREPIVPEAYVSRPTMLDISVVEVQEEGAPLAAGSRAALFLFDQVPWDDYKLERTLRWLQYSRADLLSRIEDLSEDDLRQRRIVPDRTLWDTLRHISDAEFGYITRITGPLDGKESISDEEPADLHERLLAIRDIFVRYARSLPADRRSEIIYPTWTARPDEPWTLAKSLRRALEHEREHLAEIK